MFSVKSRSLIGCWRFTGTPTQNGVVIVGNNETTPLGQDSLLAKVSESRISETVAVVKWRVAPLVGSLH